MFLFNNWMKCDLPLPVVLKYVSALKITNYRYMKIFVLSTINSDEAFLISAKLSVMLCLLYHILNV